LPVETGQALADYLQHERPTSSHPAIFVRHRGAHDQPVTSSTIQRVIKWACRRAGLMHFSAHCTPPHLGLSPGRERQFAQGGGRCAAAPFAEHHADLRQARHTEVVAVAAAVARERIMSARISLQTRDRRLSCRTASARFRTALAGHLAGSFRPLRCQPHHHRGPLTVELMVDWARQDKWHREHPGPGPPAWRLRHFIRYLKQFEPDTEVPDELIFGPEPGRVAPHIYHEDEIVELLAAARNLDHGAACAQPPTRPCSA
jgi:hypothetical protein